MRGQAHSLEGIVAALLLLGSLAFALQVTAVTPLSASTSSQHIENQQRATADGLLAVAAESGALDRAVRYWGDADGDGTAGFHDADNGRFYTSLPPTNRFGDLLERTFADRGVAYNVYVVYETPAGDHNRQRMVYRGVPSDNAVTATRLVTLHDDDRLFVDSNGDGVAEPTGRTVGSDGTFYAPDAAPSTGVYNVVRVEVTVWRL